MSVFFATAAVELRRAADSPGIVTQSCGYMVQTRLLHVVASPFGTLVESVNHDPSASFWPPAVRLLVLRSGARDVRPEACLSFECSIRATSSV